MGFDIYILFVKYQNLNCINIFLGNSNETRSETIINRRATCTYR